MIPISVDFEIIAVARENIEAVFGFIFDEAGNGIALVIVFRISVDADLKVTFRIGKILIVSVSPEGGETQTFEDLNRPFVIVAKWDGEGRDGTTKDRFEIFFVFSNLITDFIPGEFTEVRMVNGVRGDFHPFI